MNKFGFDFYIQKAQLLKEDRGRTTNRFVDTFGSEKGEFIQDIIKKIRTCLKTGKDTEGNLLIDMNGDNAYALPDKIIQHRTALYFFLRVYEWVTYEYIENDDEETEQDLNTEDDIMVQAKQSYDYLADPAHQNLNIATEIITLLSTYAEMKGVDYFSLSQEEAEKEIRNAMTMLLGDVKSSHDLIQKFYEDPLNELVKIANNINSSSKYSKKISSIAIRIIKDNALPIRNANSGIEKLTVASLFLIEQNPDKIFNEEFKTNTLNPTNLANFINGENGRVIQSSEASKAAEQRHIEIFGADYLEFGKVMAALRPTLNAIHFKERGRNLSNTRKAKNNIKASEITNKNTENVQMLLNVLDEWLILKEIIDKAFPEGLAAIQDLEDARELLSIQKFFKSEYDKDIKPETIASLLAMTPYPKSGLNILEILFQYFYKFVDVGLSYDDIETEMNNIKKALRTPQIYDYVFNEILTNVKLYVTPPDNNEFPAYNKDILDQFLTTEELRDLFRKYYQYYENWRDEIRRQEEFVKEHGHLTTPLSRGELKKIDNYLDSKPPPQKNISNESYVMDYMTEQMERDKFSNRGEFKERGFKKVKNYYQWLMINR